MRNAVQLGRVDIYPQQHAVYGQKCLHYLSYQSGQFKRWLGRPVCVVSYRQKGTRKLS